MTRADVIIVLGAAVWKGGRPSRTLERRVARGVELLRAGAAPRLLLTGGLGRNAPTEAEVMRQLATGWGAEPERLVLEDQANSTFDSARLCADIMSAHGWQHAILVTDGFHLPRSLMAFRAFGISAHGIASGAGTPGSAGRLRWAGSVVREVMALAWYAIRLLNPRERKPKDVNLGQ